MVPDAIITEILGQDHGTHTSFHTCKSPGNTRAANLRSDDEGLGSLDSSYYYKHRVPAAGALEDACI